MRVCVIGDSFVLGVGDPEHRGWVGRVAAGSAVTLSNLTERADRGAGRRVRRGLSRGRVPYVPVFDDLRADPTWTAEVAAGDGAHPGAAGYTRLAELVAPARTARVPSA